MSKVLARSGNASRFFFGGNFQTNRQNPAKRIAPKREWTWGHFPKGVTDEEGKSSGVTRKPTVNHPSSNSDDYSFELNDKNIQNQFNATIEGTDISWGIFWDWINFKITETLRGLSSTEDKRLGLWFVKNAGGKIPRKIFAEKVLKYLWDDAFKFKRKEIFSNDILSLESLISAVEDSTDENILSRIFKNYPENGSN